MGRAMLKFMNLTHAPLTNWGLGLIEFQDGCRKSNLSGVRMSGKKRFPLYTKGKVSNYMCQVPKKRALPFTRKGRAGESKQKVNQKMH